MIRLSCDCCSAILVHKLSEALGCYYASITVSSIYVCTTMSGPGPIIFGQKRLKIYHDIISREQNFFFPFSFLLLSHASTCGIKKKYLYERLIVSEKYKTED